MKESEKGSINTDSIHLKKKKNALPKVKTDI
jgi:hypothetical protein